MSPWVHVCVSVHACEISYLIGEPSHNWQEFAGVCRPYSGRCIFTRYFPNSSIKCLKSIWNSYSATYSQKTSLHSNAWFYENEWRSAETSFYYVSITFIQIIVYMHEHSPIHTCARVCIYTYQHACRHKIIQNYRYMHTYILFADYVQACIHGPHYSSKLIVSGRIQALFYDKCGLLLYLNCQLISQSLQYLHW